MKVLLVLAHPEPRSFCSALHTTAAERMRAEGHEIRVSDLYADGFDPVGDRRDFRAAADADFFKYQKEQLAAVANDGFTADLAAEMDKLHWCELAIFSFPLWWFGVPAIFGDIEHVLFPIHVGILNLVGTVVHAPFIAWSPARRSAEQRTAVLAEWRARLTGLPGERPLPMRLVADHPDPLAGTAGAYRL
jgi:NAD(P)H dehydrogenase (quinone)